MKLTEINLRDPYVLGHEGRFYLYGTRGATCWGPADGFDAYVSADLAAWSGPTVVFHNDGSFWADRDYWAPEVHSYGGAFYMLASFKGNGRRRGTAILRALSPLGPFLPWSDGPVTPKDWDCLDGTLHLDGEGRPWMVFCHEWVQAGDGTVCALPLTEDLRASDGAPTVLFHASEAPWCKRMRHSSGMTGFVTDGPFLWRLTDGSLVCLWASFSDSGYTQAQARSESGDIKGPWRQVSPLFMQNGGHGMVFRGPDSGLWLALHSPNAHLKERPRFFPVEERGGQLRLCDAQARCL